MGGDPTQVTAMGESAGAGSILHHLTAEGGTLEPLFTKAILQSPAYEYMWDRAGTQEATFQDFATLANCTGGGLTCLRAASTESLTTANTALNNNVVDGSFAVGPSADGSFVRQLAVLELASGNFAKNVESMILSHTAAESVLFVDGHIETDAQFSTFLNSIFPNYTLTAGVNAIIEEFYPPTSTNDTYATVSDRVEAFLRDSSFTCNTRYLTTAYGDANVWNMQYSVSPGWHATDLIPTFFSPILAWDTIVGDLAFAVVPLIAGISVAYQSYFTSYVKTGDPNNDRAIVNVPTTVNWGHPDSSGEQISGVLNVGDLGFGTTNDDQNEKTACDFWIEIAAAVTNLGGYAPPGAVVSQSLVPVPNDPSTNYA